MVCKWFAGLYGRTVGDPVDVVTGANLDVTTDFQLTGPLPLSWHRHYDSSQNGQPCPLGWGHSHEYDRRLEFDLDGIRYVRPVGKAVGLPPLLQDGQEHARAGLRLRRVEARLYQVHERGQPSFEFAFRDGWPAALLVRAFRGKDVVHFHYSKLGLLESITDSLGRAIRIDHDRQGHLLALTMLAGRGGKERPLLAYRYDAAGNLVEGVDAYKNAFRFRYDGSNRMVVRTDRRGYSFHFAYDDAGRCVRSAGEDGLHEVKLRYLTAERVTVVTKADGGQWTYFYDENNALTQVIDPYGGVTQYRLDDQGRIAEEVDPAGNVSRMKYDRAGGLMGKVSALGAFTPIPEDPQAPDPRAHRVPACALEWEYGDLLPLRDVTPPASDDPVLRHLPSFAVRFLRTVTPKKLAMAAGDGNGRQNTGDGQVLDELGVLLSATVADGAVRRWTYDAAGNIVRYHDADGRTWTHEYVSWNLPSRDIDPFGQAVSYRFTPLEKLAAITDVGKTISEYLYDRKSRLVQVRRHGVVREEYRYDQADNLIEKRDGKGRPLLSCEFGPGNLKTVRRLASGENHYFAFDPCGRYLRAATDSLEVRFAHDENGCCIQDERNGLGVKHRFRGRSLVETTVLGKFTIRYEHRPDGTLVIRDPAGQEHQVRTLEHGLVVRTLSNGSCEVSQFDQQGRCLVKVKSSLSRSARPWARSFWYSGEGDLLRTEDSLAGTSQYTYDPAHRLVVATLPDGKQHVFAYDPAGNLLQQPGLEGTVPREGNRLHSANGDRFEYNERNHIASREGRKGKIGFRYDARDFLTHCEMAGNVWQAEYDPLGRRTSKTFAGQRVEFYWDTDRLAAEVGPGERVRIYIYADSFALVPLLFLEYDGLAADPALGRRFFVFGNQIGAPVLIEDDRGEAVWRARIDPYGTAHVEPRSSVEMPLRFPGHYRDAETGLHYNRFRYYSPELGRYLQSDPIGIGGGANLYAYPASPLSHVDVRGLNCPNHPAGHNPDCQDCDENETTGVRKAVKPVDPLLLDLIGNPVGVHTNRTSEHPYRHPPEIYEVGPGRPLDVNALDPNSRYLWVVAPNGNMYIAPENQAGFGRPVKHGDLTPGPNGTSRGPARAGGELNYNSTSGVWEMDNNSSHTFARSDGSQLGGDSLNHSHELLTSSGTNTDNIDAVNTSGFDAPGV